MKPRILDLFCGAGGAAMGYARAGFEVVGVDIEPQPHYPFEFIQVDAIDHLQYGVPMYRVDAIHASPVCHRWSKMRLCKPGLREQAPDLITPLRPLLQATRLPYVIENVPGAPLINPIMLCGSSLGIGVRRHRLFESNIALWSLPCQHKVHDWNPAYKASTGRSRRRVPVIGEWRVPKHLQDEAMGIDWMTLAELQEAIPPAYTEFIGTQLLAAIKAAA